MAKLVIFATESVKIVGDQQDSRKRNGDMLSEKEGSVPFPNTPFGRKTKQDENDVMTMMMHLMK